MRWLALWISTAVAQWLAAIFTVTPGTAIMPVLLIFVSAQRYVIEGIARTGVKG